MTRIMHISRAYCLNTLTDVDTLFHYYLDYAL